MRIAVTGCLGMVGSALLEALIDEHDIVGLDDMSSRHHSVLFNLKNPIEFHECDVANAPLHHIFRNVDVVIHLAATTDAAGSFSNSNEVWNNNVRTTLNVVRACEEIGAKLVFPSTTSVYGPQKSLVDEKCEEIHPQSPYAISKLKCEQIIRASDADACILRLGTIYGHSLGTRYHTFVMKATWQAVVGQSITVWENAMMQRRPYLYIGDAVDSIVHVMQERLYKKSTYNVLTENHCVRDVLDVIAKYRKFQMKLVNHEILNMLSYEVDCAKFLMTGWYPFGSLDKGIGETMRSFDSVNMNMVVGVYGNG